MYLINVARSNVCHAGALSKTAIAPIETIRMQVMGGKVGPLLAAAPYVGLSSAFLFSTADVKLWLAAVGFDHVLVYLCVPRHAHALSWHPC